MTEQPEHKRQERKEIERALRTFESKGQKIQRVDPKNLKERSPVGKQVNGIYKV